MPDLAKHKVFISWSKKPTDDVATGLRSLLHHMFDNVTPWVSKDDIGLGSLSIAEIHRALAGTTFGVLIVTQRNQHEPWLNFEAGSLSKAIDDVSNSRVIPLLIDFPDQGQLAGGPLANLQAVLADESGVKSVVETLAHILDVPKATVDARWPAAWDEFAAVLETAREKLASAPGEAPRREPEDMLTEILGLVRNQVRQPLPARKRNDSPEKDLLRALQKSNLKWKRLTSVEDEDYYEYEITVDGQVTDDQMSDLLDPVKVLRKAWAPAEISLKINHHNGTYHF